MQKKINQPKEKQVTEQEPKADQTPNKPDYTGDGIAVWINTDKTTGNPYLAIKIVGHNIIYAIKRQ